MIAWLYWIVLHALAVLALAQIGWSTVRAVPAYRHARCVRSIERLEVELGYRPRPRGTTLDSLFWEMTSGPAPVIEIKDGHGLPHVFAPEGALRDPLVLNQGTWA